MNTLPSKQDSASNKDEPNRSSHLAASTRNIFEHLPQWFAAIAALIYVTGFLVVTTYDDKLGIRFPAADAFRAKYFQAGALCLMFPIGTMLFWLGIQEWKYRNHQRTILEGAEARHRWMLQGDTNLNVNAPMRWSPLWGHAYFLSVFYALLCFAPPGYFSSRATLIWWFCCALGLLIGVTKFQSAHASSTSAESCVQRPTWKKFLDRRWAFKPWEFSMFGLHLLRRCRPDDNPNALEKGWTAWTWLRILLLSCELALGIMLLWGSPARSFLRMFFDLGYLYFVFFCLIAYVGSRMQPLLRHRPWLRSPLVCVIGPVVVMLFYYQVLVFGSRIYPFIPIQRGGGSYAFEPEAEIHLDPTHRDSIDPLIIRPLAVKSAIANLEGVLALAQPPGTATARLCNEHSNSEIEGVLAKIADYGAAGLPVNLIKRLNKFVIEGNDPCIAIAAAGELRSQLSNDLVTRPVIILEENSEWLYFALADSTQLPTNKWNDARSTTEGWQKSGEEGRPDAIFRVRRDIVVSIKWKHSSGPPPPTHIKTSTVPLLGQTVGNSNSGRRPTTPALATHAASP